ncbi:DUF559 domain-containing protein [Streptomyces rimosus]|uniref:DUF559 domain-containing protein n=1 Tax=Streptomyces rimosus TaxID=1927 RepID=UPI002D21C107|nr:DUF559 domain-containing protein [Streptomyces rimosus]
MALSLRNRRPTQQQGPATVLALLHAEPATPLHPSRQPSHVSENRLCAPFQSLFEQRVYLRIKERGYDVVPQWEVNGKFIDLVVTGNHGRLAVECDGSPYHSTQQQIHDDAERERELRRAGWAFWRVRSSAFALSPEEALQPLWARLGELDIRPRPGMESNVDDDTPHPEWSPVGLSDADPDDDADPYDGESDGDDGGGEKGRDGNF